MAGVASNLTSMLEDRYHRGGKYEEITDRADAPLEDAVALMVRERLTGLKPPPAAARIVDLWRDFVEERAGRDLDGLLRNIERQRDFARGVRELLSSLDMADDAPSILKTTRATTRTRRSGAAAGRGRGRAGGAGRPRRDGGFRRRQRGCRGRRDGSRRRADRRDARRCRGGGCRGSLRGMAAAVLAFERAARAGLQGVHPEVRRDRPRRGPAMPTS